MNKKQPCSALVSGPEKPKFLTQKQCKHGHATTSPCYGISADVLMPVCVQENRQFDERTQTVRLHHWRGA